MIPEDYARRLAVEVGERTRRLPLLRSHNTAHPSRVTKPASTQHSRGGSGRPTRRGAGSSIDDAAYRNTNHDFECLERSSSYEPFLDLQQDPPPHSLPPAQFGSNNLFSHPGSDPMGDRGFYTSYHSSVTGVPVINYTPEVDRLNARTATEARIAAMHDEIERHQRYLDHELRGIPFGGSATEMQDFRRRSDQSAKIHAIDDGSYSIPSQYPPPKSARSAPPPSYGPSRSSYQAPASSYIPDPRRPLAKNYDNQISQQQRQHFQQERSRGGSALSGFAGILDGYDDSMVRFYNRQSARATAASLGVYVDSRSRVHKEWPPKPGRQCRTRNSFKEDRIAI